MYLLYRLGRSAKLQRYMPEATVFVLVVSFLSTRFPVGMAMMVTFPVTFLSWPAYHWLDYTRIFENYTPHYVWSHGIRFLTLDIAYTSPWKYSPQEEIFEFLFFLEINILGSLLGALLGRWIAKKHRIQFFGSKWWKVLWGSVGIICMGLLPFTASLHGTRAGIALFGFGIVLLETTFLSWLIDKIRIPHPRKKALDYVKISYKRMRKKGRLSKSHAHELVL